MSAPRSFADKLAARLRQRYPTLTITVDGYGVCFPTASLAQVHLPAFSLPKVDRRQPPAAVAETARTSPDRGRTRTTSTHR